MKSTHSIIFYCCIVALLCTHCTSDTSKQEEVQPEPTVQEEIVEIFAVNRKNFRLRDRASMSVAKKIGLVSYGDFLLFLNEKSSEKIPVTLGLRTYNEPFYKIKDLGSDTTEGWIHGSGFVRIFKGGKSKYPNFDLLSEYGRKIGELPPNKLKSCQKALEYTKQSLTKANPETADALYIMFTNFLNINEVESKYYDNLEESFEPTRKEWEAIYKGDFDMNSTSMTQELAAAGYRLNTSEGMLFPTIDYVKLAALFNAKATPAMNTYIQLQVEEDINRATEDAGIALPLKDLADRAIRYEQFNINYPNFPIKTSSNGTSWLHFLLVCGADNTPIYDWESKEVRKEILENWNYILSAYPDSQLASSVKERQATIQAAGGLVTEKAQEFCGRLAQEI